MGKLGVEVKKEHIVLIKGGTSKHDALNQLIDSVAQDPDITDREALRRAVHEREAVMSTGIGGGIAIPHVRIPEVLHPVLGVGLAPKGLEFATLDNRPVHVMVLFATPADSQKEYLTLLAQVMMALRSQELFQQLVACRSANDVYNLLEK